MLDDHICHEFTISISILVETVDCAKINRVHLDSSTVRS